MLPLLFAGIVFFFLLLGALVFVACLIASWTRRYALSAALWFAMWGPCSVTLMVLAGVGLIASAFITKSGDLESFHTPQLLRVFGWSYLVAGLLITTFITTASAWIHQAVINRIPDTLFRAYAAIIAGGIGSVFGWCLGWWFLYRDSKGYIWLLVWIVCMVALIGTFGSAAHRWSRNLRKDVAVR